MALAMRPVCECCGTALPADEPGAYVCSMECTFCAPCTHDVLKGASLNCGGVLTPRPTRVGEALARHPAAASGPVKPEGCAHG